jgi:hypothetical protein
LREVLGGEVNHVYWHHAHHPNTRRKRTITLRRNRRKPRIDSNENGASSKPVTVPASTGMTLPGSRTLAWKKAFNRC